MNDREMLGSVGRGSLCAVSPRHLSVIGHCGNQAVSHFLDALADNPHLPYSPEWYLFANDIQSGFLFEGKPQLG